MRKSTKSFLTAKSIPEATTEDIVHYIKGCLIDFTPDIVKLLGGTNNMKKDISPQEKRANVIRLAEEVPDGSKRDVLIIGTIDIGGTFNAKIRKVYNMLSLMNCRKNVTN